MRITRVRSNIVEALEKYPCYVAPAQGVLDWQTVDVHEDLEKQQLVAEVAPDQEFIFISQTWLGMKHPDPTNVKLLLLQQLLQSMRDSACNFLPEWRAEMSGTKTTVAGQRFQKAWSTLAVWFDRSSIPQRDVSTQLDAIESIPAYVARAAFFVVLVPPSKHENGLVRDYHQWSVRGWCRMEEFALVHSPKRKPCLVVESMSCLYVKEAGCQMFRPPVGLGKFNKQADVEILGPIIQSVVETQANLGLLTEDIRQYRYYLALERFCLQGTGEANKMLPDRFEAELDEWLTRMRFQTPQCEQRTGWCPLRFAIISNSAPVTQALLERNADASSKLHKSGFLHVPNSTLLHELALFWDSPSMLTLLMDHKADPDTGDKLGATVLHYAAVAERPDTMRVLLARNTQATEMSLAGHSPWHLAVEHPRCSSSGLETMKFFYENYPQVVSSLPGTHRFGGTLLMSACVGHAGVEMLEYLLSEGEQLEAEAQPRTMSAKSLTFLLQTAHAWSSEQSDLAVFFANLPGARVLHVAAIFARLVPLEFLISKGCMVNARNSYGRTPLALGAMRGHLATVQLLLDNQSDPWLRDSWGRDAVAWARISGSAALLHEFDSRGLLGHVSVSTSCCKPAVEESAEEILAASSGLGAWRKTSSDSADETWTPI